MVNLITKLFTLKPGNMRSLRIYRLLQVMWLIPFFTLLLIINNIALILDWILFPKFKAQKIYKPVFIVSLPRTGTTNLLHGLTTPNSQFTAMSLWEILLAPAIIQKKTYRLLWKFSPVFIKQAIKKFDKLIFRKLSTIHKVSLFKKEEDDIIMMWSLSSVYLSFFYPESNVMRDLFRFDTELSEKRKNRIMKKYYRKVQRHLYSLGQNDKKRYLSKNPSMAVKMESISKYFSDAKVIVIDRDPCIIFPSTEFLQKQLFNFATDVPTSLKESNAIMNILEEFRSNLQLTLVEKKLLPCIVISFQDLVKHREKTMNALLKLLNCKSKDFETDNEQHKTKANYTTLKQEELEKILRKPWPSWPKEMFLKIDTINTIKE